TLVVSLIDFGLALRTFEPNKRSTLFPLGFAAPELILNRLDLVDQRTDLYALGIVIWRLYDGKLPLTHPNPSVFTNLQLTHPLPESDKLPKGLHNLLQKLSAKHQFKTAPNLMDNQAVLAGLKEGMDQRYSELSVFIEEFRSLPKRQKWLLFNKGLF
ncbi:MAG: protein kinase domain-containing protein, partial [Flavobacteriia bacterium]